MKHAANQFRSIVRGSVSIVPVVLAIWVLAGIGPDSGRAMALGAGADSTTGATSPAVTCPAGQCFHDVPPTNLFYTTTNNLYLDNIISGYACGGTSEPCDAQHRPYYRPTNNVNRGQMSKFVDNGRKNISDAIGHSLYISTTAGIAGDFETRSGGEAIYAQCLQSGNNCYALEGYAPTGDYAGDMYGGKGVYAESDDAGQPGMKAAAYGATSYAMYAQSDQYRGGYVKSNDSSLYSLYVDTQDGPSQGTSGLEVNGSIRGEGNLYIAGSKAGYVVDIMQNVDSEALEAGDVVTIVGNGAPVLGQIPVVTIKKATSAYDTGVVGIVDQSTYVPDQATKAAYDKQQADWRTAMDRQEQATQAARLTGTKPNLSNISIPDMTITDEQGTLHALPEVTKTATGGYVSVVTLGSYKAVKVDTSFGAIHAGDLLTTSPHAGYAMKVTDKSQAFGATIGKALGDLETGTGIIPVMVTLK